MSNSFGNKIKFTVFGQSHSQAMGIVIDGLPAGFEIDMESVQRFMQRRAPGRNATSTARKESDVPHIISGIVDGKTCGAALCAIIENTDARSRDYDKLKVQPRPSHADFAAYMKTGGFNDIRGGGQFSGRLTAPLCFAGAVCMQLLKKMGVTIGAQIIEIGGIRDDTLSPEAVTANALQAISAKEFSVNDDSTGNVMQQAILTAKNDLDSVGGIIRGYAIGVPVGLGDPMFDGMENRLAQAMFAIPAVKGISFGAGFEAARMTGSKHNDSFTMKDGKVVTVTNNHGGILGGITTGMPIWFDCAFKPTPSIARSQNTVDLAKGENVQLEITGRHDPCIVGRAVPCVEAMTAIVLADLML